MCVWGFSPTPVHYNYEVPLSQFRLYTELLKTNFPNLHFRRVAFWPVRELCASANGGRMSPYFRPLQLRGLPHFPFYGFTELLKVISRIITSGESHFGQKVDIYGPPTVGGIHSYSAHRDNEGGFHCPNFTDVRNFYETVISQITTSDEPHFGRGRRFRWNANSGGEFSHISARCKYEGFRSSNSTVRVTLKVIHRIATSRESRLV